MLAFLTSTEGRIVRDSVSLHTSTRVSTFRFAVSTSQCGVNRHFIIVWSNFLLNLLMDGWSRIAARSYACPNFLTARRIELGACHSRRAE